MVTGATLADAAIHLAAMPVPAASPRDQPTAGTAPRPTQAGVWRGTVVAAAARRVQVHERGRERTYAAAAGASVVRNGQPSRLGALQPHDVITVTTNAAGALVRVAAWAPPHPAVVPPRPRTMSLADLLTLPALLVFLLLLLPLLAGTLRRRRQQGAPSSPSPAGRRPTVRPVTFTAGGPRARQEGGEPNARE